MYSIETLVPFILICVFVIWRIHKMASEWKNTVSLVFGLFGTIAGVNIGERIIEKHYPDPGTKASFDSLRVEHVRIIDSQNAIKSMLRGLPPQMDIKAMEAIRDSLLAKIALLDGHIDRHFYRVDSRFSVIDERLDER